MQYPNIDTIRTGIRLKRIIKEAGYDVKYIQKYLHLSCPQPVYRWFKGKILPSLNHLYALSVLLGLPMEKLIVPQKEATMKSVLGNVKEPTVKRLLSYYTKICEVA